MKQVHDDDRRSVTVDVEQPPFGNPFQHEWQRFVERQPMGQSTFNCPGRVLFDGSQATPKPYTFVVFRRAGEVVAIAPFWQAPGLPFPLLSLAPWSKRIRVFRMVGDTFGDNFVHERSIPLASIVQPAFDRLFSLQPPPDVVYLRGIELTSELWSILNSKGFAALGFKTVTHHHMSEDSFAVQIDGPLDLFLQSLPRTTRRKLQYQQRRLFRELPGTEIVRVTDAAQVPWLLDHVERIDQYTWQGIAKGKQRTPRNSPESLALFHELAQLGILRSYLLLQKDEAIAFALRNQFAGVCDAVGTGYLPTFQRWSPGRLLLWSVIQDLHEWNPPRILRLGWGREPYKRSMCNRIVPTMDLWVTRSNAIASAIQLQRHMHTMKHRLALPLLAKLGLTPKRGGQAGASHVDTASDE